MIAYLFSLLLLLQGSLTVPMARQNSSSGGGTIAEVANGTANGTTPQTAGINMTGANLLVMDCAGYTTGGATFTPSDSSSNTWHAGTVQQASDDQNQLFYAYSPTVTSSQTFECAGVTAGCVSVIGFSGALAGSGVFDSQTNAQADQPGSITPAGSGEAFVTGASTATTSSGLSIGSSFTITNSNINGAYEICGMAYYINSGSSAQNPTWAGFNTNLPNATMMAFKP